MNTIYTKQAPDAIGPYSQAIKVGNLVYTSGQIAINPATGHVEATDIEGQSRQVMKNLEAVLAAAGCTFANVVKTTCFLKDVAKDFAAFNAIYAEALGDSKPARSCVGVAELPKGVLVEVEVIAVIE
ncbi:MAG: RidA family protein [Ruminococcus sp.]